MQVKCGGLSFGLLFFCMLMLASTVKGLVLDTSSLKLLLTRETADGVLLTWVTDAPRAVIVSCTLYYGPLTDTLHVQTEVSPFEEYVTLHHLTANLTYYAYINCLTVKQSSIISNTVHFTPHGGYELTSLELETLTSDSGKPSSTASWAQAPSSQREYHPVYQEDDHIVIMMKQRHMESTRFDYPQNSRPSTSVILGAICGVVGFVIINVTVVLVVRQISNRRARQRRLQELQLQQHGGYIYNLDELLQNYNNQVNSFGQEVPWEKLEIHELPQEMTKKIDTSEGKLENVYQNT